jgi:hypothetical protein
MDYSLIQEKLAEVMRHYAKVDEMESCWKVATGEVKDAFALITRDYLWKMNTAMGKLQYELIKQVQDVERRVIGKTMEEECEDEKDEEKKVRFDKPVFIPAQGFSDYEKAVEEVKELVIPTLDG